MKFECRFEDNSKYFHFIIVKVVMLLQSISVVIAFIGTLRYERQDMYDLERAIKSGRANAENLELGVE